MLGIRAPTHFIRPCSAANGHAIGLTPSRPAWRCPRLAGLLRRPTRNDMLRRQDRTVRHHPRRPRSHRTAPGAAQNCFPRHEDTTVRHRVDPHCVTTCLQRPPDRHKPFRLLPRTHGAIPESQSSADSPLIVGTHHAPRRHDAERHRVAQTAGAPCAAPPDRQPPVPLASPHAQHHSPGLFSSMRLVAKRMCGTTFTHAVMHKHPRASPCKEVFYRTYGRSAPSRCTTRRPPLISPHLLL